MTPEPARAVAEIPEEPKLFAVLVTATLRLLGVAVGKLPPRCRDVLAVFRRRGGAPPRKEVVFE